MDSMKSSEIDQQVREISRRAFLGRGAAAGLGSVALGCLAGKDHLAAPQPAGKWRGVVNPLHHAAKAKRVIFLYQAGGPSQFETFDYKPELARMHGKPMPESAHPGPGHLAARNRGVGRAAECGQGDH